MEKDLVTALRNMTLMWRTVCISHGWDPYHLVEYEEALKVLIKVRDTSLEKDLRFWEDRAQELRDRLSSFPEEVLVGGVGAIWKEELTKIEKILKENENFRSSNPPG